MANYMNILYEYMCFKHTLKTTPLVSDLSSGGHQGIF